MVAPTIYYKKFKITENIEIFPLLLEKLMVR